MKKSRDKDSFIKKPEYPGGREAQKKFVTKNLRYPKEALDKKIEGKVILTFRVEFDGNVGDVRILKSLGHGCDEEAARVVSMMKYSVQKNRGSRVSIKRRLTISFKLPKKKKAPARSIKYTITPSSDKVKKTTYSYTIKKN